MNIWELDKLNLFVIFVIPGFVSLKAYELLHPGGESDSSKRLVDAITYSCLTYALLYWPILAASDSATLKDSPTLRYFFYFFVLFAFPVLIVLAWDEIRKTQFIQRKTPHPTGKPWDYVFSQRKSYWVKVTLKNGESIGGRYSDKSFASSAPAPEQIYLEEKWILGEKGKFIRKANRTAGIIILSSEISHVEMKEYIEEDLQGENEDAG